MDDMDLLKEYASRSSESAFATLVSRHIDMVYSVAMRCTGNHHHAEEITQAVFALLAAKAGSLSSGIVLSGWLFHTARLTAANFVRKEIRRTRREQEAFMQSNMQENQTAIWEQIAPLLDDAIADLGEKDRNAVVLRFVNGKDYSEVAAALGTTAQSAQVRVSRAVEKLRKIFSKRGVVLSGVALGGAISANSIQAAPAGLAMTITSAAVQGTALTASTVTLAKGAVSFMAWTKITVGAGLVVLFAYQWHGNNGQARQIASAQENLAQTTREIGLREADISESRRQNIALAEEIRGELSELQRLRVQRQSAAAAAHSAGGKRSASILAAGLEDPAAREALRQTLMNLATNRYSEMVQELNLSPEVAEKFYSMIADAGMSNLDTTKAVNEGKISATDAKQVDFSGALRELLGDEGYAAFGKHSTEFPGRTVVNQLQQQLGDNQLTEDQRQQLLSVIRSEPHTITAALAGDFDIRSLTSEDGLQKRFQQQAEVVRQILDQAANFLTPDQLNALGLMYTNNMNRQRLNGERAFRQF